MSEFKAPVFTPDLVYLQNKLTGEIEPPQKREKIHEVKSCEINYVKLFYRGRWFNQLGDSLADIGNTIFFTTFLVF